jgi:cysteine desulfurase / selenocysteine lyase
MGGAYLDYAGIGLVRPAAVRAVHEAVDDVLAAGSPAYGRFFAAREAARSSAARLLGCDPDEVALVPNTSAGLHVVADGLDWQPGDEVVVFDRDFPANVHPWRRLAGRGVIVRWVPERGGGYDLDDVAELVGPATRLVAVSHVNFLTGFRIDLDAVCSIAAAAGALVCVDAVQSLGALPVDVGRTPVDFAVAGAHKWLCAPPGTGLLFCRRKRLELLRWAPAGWFGFDRSQDLLVKGDGHFTYDLPLRPGARRVEGGMPNFVGIVGLAAALAELEDAGPCAVAERVLCLASRLRDGIAARGYDVLGRPEPAARSGVVTFAAPDAARLHDDLTGKGFHLSFPDGRLRVSAHFWSADGDVDALVDELPPRRLRS